MNVRKMLAVIAAIAALNGAFFIHYQAPDWSTEWSDQEGYKRLGRSLAETGQFTRYPESPTFVPEVIRTPGYPLFVAGIYKLFGPSQIAVAIAQAALFVAIAVMVFAIARCCTTTKIALAASALTAAYPTLPYYGALVMTELWTAFVLTAAFVFAFRARRTGARRDYVATGVLLGVAALSRPAFVLLPFAIFGVGALLFWRDFRRIVQPWALVIGVFLLMLVPWLAFNYSVIGRVALAPAGGVGRGLWEGSWQGRWPGRLHNELTHLAADTPETETLDARVDRLAADNGFDPVPMRTYVHQWRELRQIWDAPTDPQERAAARIKADEEYRRVALENIRADLAGHIRRRLSIGTFVLWDADIPLRSSEINSTSPLLIRTFWSAQVVLVLLAVWGTICLIKQGRLTDAWILVTPLLYVTAVHVPLLTEARQSLPVKPLLLIAAAIGGADLWQRLLPLKAQVHERQHV